jgi:hypothetical protein
VILRPELFPIDGTPAIDTAYLLGVVSGFVPWTDLAVSPRARSRAG